MAGPTPYVFLHFEHPQSITDKIRQLDKIGCNVLETEETDKSVCFACCPTDTAMYKVILEHDDLVLVILREYNVVENLFVPVIIFQKQKKL